MELPPTVDARVAADEALRAAERVLRVAAEALRVAAEALRVVTPERLEEDDLVTADALLRAEAWRVVRLRPAEREAPPRAKD